MVAVNYEKRVTTTHVLEVPDGAVWPNEKKIVDLVYLLMLREASLKNDFLVDKLRSGDEYQVEWASSIMCSKYTLAEMIVREVREGGFEL